MNCSLHELFTAAEIAKALNLKRPNVARQLSSIAPSGFKLASGNDARAWSVESLPAKLRAPLENLRKRLHCKSAAEAVRQCSSPWAPAIGLTECHPDCLAQARKLREALRTSFARQNAPGLSAAEFEALGVEDYRRSFGYTITTRRWRELFTRTLHRAGDVPDFERLDIYLPERLKRRDSAAPMLTLGAQETETRLSAFVSVFADPGNPTARQRESLWREAMQEMESLVEQGTPHRRAGSIVRAALLKVAPFLAPSNEALQKSFLRKWSAWQSTGGAAHSVRDRRRTNTGNHDGYELPQADVDTLLHKAVWQRHGSILGAWIDAHQANQLTPATAARYPLDPRRRHVPHKIRQAIGAEVEIFMLMKRGRRAIDELTPSVARTFDGIYSGQIIQGDDFTMPVYFSHRDGGGETTITRGQVLLFIDFRSEKIVGWATLPDPQYGSLAIWTQLKRIFKEHGIPKLLYFERGIWKNSKLLTGRQSEDPAEVVQGLWELGIQFKHAIRPRSKTVERVGGLLQDLMEGEPGYCGRDERRDMPAATKEALLRVNSHKATPAEAGLYSFEQWDARLGEIIATYNARPQFGKHLDGLSPDQAFEQFRAPEDERRLSSWELEFLLTHKEPRTVTPNGITFQVGKNRFRYYGPELASFVGRRVLAAFDPEMPEHLIVTDLNRQSAQLVPLASEVSAMAELTGNEDTLKHELSRAAGQMAHLRARYNVVKSILPLRKPTAESTANLIAGARVQHLRKQATEKKQAAERTQRKARQIGVAIPDRTRGRADTLDDVNTLTRFLEATPKPEHHTP